MNRWRFFWMNPGFLCGYNQTDGCNKPETTDVLDEAVFQADTNPPQAADFMKKGAMDSAKTLRQLQKRRKTMEQLLPQRDGAGAKPPREIGCGAANLDGAKALKSNSQGRMLEPKGKCQRSLDTYVKRI